ncbi:MAG: hypothetical protein LUB59_07145 [Candidatus Gastranaerophilales bacterium]|nr:hypothetical protein [Candidatus Gastranaerophilales bacterium]
MMRISIPLYEDFNYDECENLYYKYQSVINDSSSFNEVIKNTLFYAFYDDDILCLCVYFFEINGKIWVNGYGTRKHHLFNKKCFKLALSWFNCDIWAECSHKPAIFGLLCCGFKKFKDNIYVFRQNVNTL